eukprot:CAMPEP_0185747446 /NCGR_PEP_ID=MMETSP1174-20130828/6062_1 /TAXON_ID=35687 /ORGANISM="Dictyocha speculum, Strain CCMP1381" /LENGTH=551 /DNA_ID=CAMNT_0028422615 /DNA_START=13 /DNA_END=1668 /DNA_ORIENTATION=-
MRRFLLKPTLPIARPNRATSLRGVVTPATVSGDYLLGEHGLWIDGKEVPSSGGGKIPIENPATGEIIATVAEGREDDIRTAVSSAAKSVADARWSSVAPRERSKILGRAADLLQARLPDLARIETLSTGRCLREYTAQLQRVPEWFTYHGALAMTMEGSVPPFSDEDHLCVVRREPLGVCALVTPWNHPLLIAAKKVSVALAAGNSIVVKPPELAPISVLELAKVLSDAGLPPGVMNVVPGYGHTAGAALAAEPGIAKLDFTGGTATGKAIGAVVGGNVKHYCAELGGNCPVLVFPDCDIDEAVNGVAFGAFVASGQTCVSAKRILVHASIYDAFVEKLAAKARGLRLGDPMDMTSQMGPLVSGPQLATVASQVDRAREEGATVLTGGCRADRSRLWHSDDDDGDDCGITALLKGGHYYEPTVLTSVSPAMSCFQDEIFGPVVSVVPFQDETHALSLANDSPYGLGAAVWTSDVRRAHRMARDICAGVLWVNAHHRNDASAPWGGFKDSGIGRENGIDALREYTASKTTVFRMSDQKEDWFSQTTPQARYS